MFRQSSSHGAGPAVLDFLPCLSLALTHRISGLERHRKDCPDRFLDLKGWPVEAAIITRGERDPAPSKRFPFLFFMF